MSLAWFTMSLLVLTASYGLLRVITWVQSQDFVDDVI
jgi:hypothetical protein